MKKFCYYLLYTTFIFISFLVKSQESIKKDQEYIRKFAATAIQEMNLYKIPASIKLGQGLLETANGQSELAKNANNHFGIKCKTEWSGQTYRYTDDAYMECFRKYESPDDSYRDHSLFLVNRKHYSNLFNLNIDDYKGWAYGLKKAGYATNPKYPQILISKIEKYKLYEFDNIKNNKDLIAKLDILYPESKNMFIASREKKNNEPFKVKNNPQDKNRKIISGDLTPKEINPDQKRLHLLISHKNKEKNKTNQNLLVKEKIEKPEKPEYEDSLINYTQEINTSESESYDLQSFVDSDQIKSENITENNNSNINKDNDSHKRIKIHHNNLKYIVVNKNETLKSISLLFKIPISDLKNFNDINNNQNTLKENQNIFLEYKKSKSKDKYYIVQQGETMYDISQKLGIKLDELYRRNKMDFETQPIPGQTILLKGIVD